MSEENEVPRSDAEFKNFVCNSLRELQTQIDANTEITKDIEEIVRMGRGMFKFAYAIGSALRWISGVVGGAVLIYHFLWDHIKEAFR